MSQINSINTICNINEIITQSYPHVQGRQQQCHAIVKQLVNKFNT